MQTIKVQTALGRYINTSASNSMQQSFTEAANQLMIDHSTEVKMKYPELGAWQDIQKKLKN
jgi:hypothetical protein